MNIGFDGRLPYEAPQAEAISIKLEACILSTVDTVQDYHGERITSSSEPGF